MNLDIEAFLIPIVILVLLLFLTRWTSRPSRPTAQIVDPRTLKVIASDMPRPEAMELRARLGEAGIQTSMTPRRGGAVDVLTCHDDLRAARALLEL